jgi:hypothetical protein
MDLEKTKQIMIKFDRIETGDVTRSDWSVNGFLLWVYGSRERGTHTHTHMKRHWL